MCIWVASSVLWSITLIWIPDADRIRDRHMWDCSAIQTSGNYLVHFVGLDIVIWLYVHSLKEPKWMCFGESRHFYLLYFSRVTCNMAPTLAVFERINFASNWLLYYLTIALRTASIFFYKVAQRRLIFNILVTKYGIYYLFYSCVSEVNTIEAGYNDIGEWYISSTAWDILWYQLITEC
jgi:hypothetical protein